MHANFAARKVDGTKVMIISSFLRRVRSYVDRVRSYVDRIRSYVNRARSYVRKRVNSEVRIRISILVSTFVHL